MSCITFCFAVAVKHETGMGYLNLLVSGKTFLRP